MKKKSFFLPAPPGSGFLPEIKNEKRRLSNTSRLAYSFGHVFNDLCASLWFSYFLLYLKSVLLFKSTTAGLLLLIGQAVDAAATPLVGWESDRRNSILSICCIGYGKRKAWHLFGTILVLLSFPFMFQECLVGCASPESGHWSPLLYYAFLISVFQVGWAAVQVSHVTLITDLTPYPKERLALNVYRHMATVTSNITVYGITWLVLHESNHGDDQIGPHSLSYFRTIVLAVAGTGIACSIVFHLFVREDNQKPKSQSEASADSNDVYGHYKKDPNKDCNSNNPATHGQSLFLQSESVYDEKPAQQSVFAIGTSPNTKEHSCAGSDQLSATSQDALWTQEYNKRKSQLTWRQWLTKIRFYQVALLYLASRLFVNISQVYMALYLQYTLVLPKETLAIIPLVVNVSGLLFALLLKPISAKIGNKSSLVLGCLLGACACVWVHLFVPTQEQKTFLIGGWQVYAIGALLGLGGTTLLVASLGITADLIGTNMRSSAFVFGVMSLFDKLASGGAIMIVQYFEPSKNQLVPEISTPYYRQVLVFGCGASLFLTVIGMVTMLLSCFQQQTAKTNDQKSVTPDHDESTVLPKKSLEPA